MISMLMNCPDCGLMIPKDGPCAECHWSEKGEEGAMLDQQTVLVFAQRRRAHQRNYAVFMILMFATGLIGLLTSFMWIRIIYLGHVVAFVWLVILTALTGVMTVVLGFSKKLFPVELHCPCCNIRLDELGTDGNHCPNCSALLT